MASFTAITARFITILLSILESSSRILRNSRLIGAWYLSPDPSYLCASKPDFWTSVPTAYARFVQRTDLNALPWPAHIFMVNPMYKDAQEITNASLTASTVWKDRDVAELNPVSMSTTCSTAFFSIHIRSSATSSMKTISDDSRENRKRCVGALNVWQVSHLT